MPKIYLFLLLSKDSSYVRRLKHQMRYFLLTYLNLAIK